MLTGQDMGRDAPQGCGSAGCRSVPSEKETPSFRMVFLFLEVTPGFESPRGDFASCRPMAESAGNTGFAGNHAVRCCRTVLSNFEVIRLKIWLNFVAARNVPVFSLGNAVDG